MQIDIRSQQSDKVEEIVFADDNGDDGYVLTLKGNYSEICSSDDRVYIDSKKDAQNLIKALQKAIELVNWE